jgi:hypothetical protein
MKKIAGLSLMALMLAAFPAAVSAQVAEIGEANVRPTPEIKKLFEALAGDWDTSEKRERTQFFPNGGERKGRTRVRLGAGGAMLVMEGHSDGTAGPLSYIIVVWWDKDANLIVTSPVSKTRKAAAKFAARPIGMRTSS